MRSPPRLVLFSLLAFLVLPVACGPSEPTFEGKTASEWAEVIVGPTRGAELLERGSAAVPILVEIATFRYGLEPGPRAEEILLDMDATAIPSLLRILETGNSLNRRASLGVLGELGPENEAVVAAVRKMLSDPDQELRGVAASNLYQLTGETETVLPVLIKDLERGEYFAAELMMTMGADAAPYTARLATLLEAEEPLTRIGAVRVLRVIGPGASAALPDLRHCVEGPVPDAGEVNVRRIFMRESAAALVGIAPSEKDGERLLLWFLEHGNAQEVADAARALWKAGLDRPEVEAALRNLVAHRQTAHWAADVLAQIGPDAAWAVPRLAALLDDTESRDGQQIGWGWHMDFARALGRMGPAAKVALPSLERAMTDLHVRVRPIAALAVYRIGGDPDAVIRALVAVADAGPDPGDWGAKDAVGALEEIAAGDPAARAVLKQLTTHSRSAVRRAARAALRKLE